MANKEQSKCLCCGDLLPWIHATTAGRSTARTPTCRPASKAPVSAAGSRSRENQNYFSGPLHVVRVRDLASAHPGYWRARGAEPASALQDALAPKSLSPQRSRRFSVTRLSAARKARS